MKNARADDAHARSTGIPARVLLDVTENRMSIRVVDRSDAVLIEHNMRRRTVMGGTWQGEQKGSLIEAVDVLAKKLGLTPDTQGGAELERFGESLDALLDASDIANRLAWLNDGDDAHPLDPGPAMTLPARRPTIPQRKRKVG